MSLEERVASLERELEQLRAEREGAPLVMRDAQGRKRLEFSSSEHDHALKFFNSSGTLALSIGVDGTECGYIGICNAEGKVVAKLDVEQYGARLELLDSHWDNDSAVVIHGNDCDNAGGLILVLPPDDGPALEICCGDKAPDGT